MMKPTANFPGVLEFGERSKHSWIAVGDFEDAEMCIFFSHFGGEKPPKPIPSMYGVCTYIGLFFFVVNVGKCSIHGC